MFLVQENYVYTRVQIQWTDERERALVRLFKESDTSTLGFLRRLTTAWNHEFRELNSTETAISQGLYVICSRVESFTSGKSTGVNVSEEP